MHFTGEETEALRIGCTRSWSWKTEAVSRSASVWLQMWKSCMTERESHLLLVLHVLGDCLPLKLPLQHDAWSGPRAHGCWHS